LTPKSTWSSGHKNPNPFSEAFHGPDSRGVAKTEDVDILYGILAANEAKTRLGVCDEVIVSYACTLENRIGRSKATKTSS